MFEKLCPVKLYVLLTTQNPDHFKNEAFPLPLLK